MDGQERGAVMRAGRRPTSTTAIPAACLMLGLLLAGCTSAPGTLPSAGDTSSAPVVGPSSSVRDVASDGAPNTPSSTSTATGSGTADRPDAFATPSTIPGSGGAGADSGSGDGGTAVAPTPGPSAAAEPLPVATPSSSPTAVAPVARAATVPQDLNLGPAVYYVAVDDGGARGVRFGCNDSLVPVRGALAPGDPLTLALSRLLEAGMPLDTGAGLYDSLANSSLHFVSGYVSGATVVVNLSGTLLPGGVCDIPRIEAQLTHTIVSASGASRAEIYINGKTLAEALSLR
ncbi:hypothetical protein ABIE18_002355 [Arthrobacter sp. 2762]